MAPSRVTRRNEGRTAAKPSASAKDPDKQQRLIQQYQNKLALYSVLEAQTANPLRKRTEEELSALEDAMEWELDPVSTQPPTANGQVPLATGVPGQAPLNGYSPPPAGAPGQAPFNGYSPPPVGAPGQPQFNGYSPPPAGAPGQPQFNGYSPPPAGASGQAPFNGYSPPPVGVPEQSLFVEQSPPPVPLSAADLNLVNGQYDVDNVSVLMSGSGIRPEGANPVGYICQGGNNYYNIYQMGGEGQYKKYFTELSGNADGEEDLVEKRPEKPKKKGREKNGPERNGPERNSYNVYSVQGVTLKPNADINSLVPRTWLPVKLKNGDIKTPAPWCQIKVLLWSGVQCWMPRGTFQKKWGNYTILAPEELVHEGNTIVELGNPIGYADFKIIHTYIKNQQNYGKDAPTASMSRHRSPTVVRWSPEEPTRGSEPPPDVYQNLAPPASRYTHTGPNPPGGVFQAQAAPQATAAQGSYQHQAPQAANAQWPPQQAHPGQHQAPQAANAQWPPQQAHPGQAQVAQAVHSQWPPQQAYPDQAQVAQAVHSQWPPQQAYPDQAQVAQGHKQSDDAFSGILHHSYWDPKKPGYRGSVKSEIA